VELVVVGMSVAPSPVFVLLAALGLRVGHVIFGMFYTECLVGALFAIIQVMVVLVVAIVDPDADRLRCSVGRNRHRSNQSST
jgi:hypothetical protein